MVRLPAEKGDRFMKHRITCVQWKNEKEAGVVTHGDDGTEEGVTRTLILSRILMAGVPPEALPDAYARIVYHRDTGGPIIGGHYEIAEIYQVPAVGMVQPPPA